MKNIKNYIFLIIYILIVFFIVYLGSKGISNWYNKPYFPKNTEKNFESNMIFEQIPYKISFKYNDKRIDIVDSEFIINSWNKIKKLPYYTESTISKIGENAIKGKFIFLNEEYKNFILDEDLKIEDLYYGNEKNTFIINFKSNLMKYYEKSIIEID
ncbi:DUF3919 family protein [Oceanotoga sp. DSM 15011]|jgi:hypothetical protein|uniref:Uncharacterized protein DUF3919 n=1 Tax=Oceanotoga teriensis TaxID=515440 RepID=A0AA45HHP3_9BACT|nr:MULTISPECIES: DUF3919 family protein [Oceanotoga]MDN5341960.1 hypothetical protein [Oceanotoga sp.]MDO7976522.1 DUF3919 family protein [Oceanotoga teriensis]PWJ87880.1 uncharacterized protein DUF3919 [Oceanotoga teriensis]UYO99237.1 DUF3919 family protein [Oceanotoga sp. DSM 15011]